MAVRAAITKYQKQEFDMERNNQFATIIPS